MQHSRVQQSVESVLKELAQLATGNNVLKSHLDSKADKSYLLQVGTALNAHCSKEA